MTLPSLTKHVEVACWDVSGVTLPELRKNCKVCPACPSTAPLTSLGLHRCRLSPTPKLHEFVDFCDQNKSCVILLYVKILLCLLTVETRATSRAPSFIIIQKMSVASLPFSCGKVVYKLVVHFELYVNPTGLFCA